MKLCPCFGKMNRPQICIKIIFDTLCLYNAHHLCRRSTYVDLSTASVTHLPVLPTLYSLITEQIEFSFVLK